MGADEVETLMQERDERGVVHLPAFAGSGARFGESRAVALELPHARPARQSPASVAGARCGVFD